MIELCALLGVNAVGGGWYGFAGAQGVDPSWLAGSPFSDHTLPSLFLLVVIGGGALSTATAWWLRLRVAPLLTVGLGAIVIAWIVIRVAIITLNSALLPVFFTAGAILVATGARVLLRRPTPGHQLAG